MQFGQAAQNGGRGETPHKGKEGMMKDHFQTRRPTEPPKAPTRILRHFSLWVLGFLSFPFFFF